MTVIGAYDPCRAVYDALDRAGFEPHGPEYNFRSRCPVHNGDNEYSLVVSEGMDGRAVLHCFARQCSARDITQALGMRMSELFPDHHHRAPRDRRPARVRHADPLVSVLAAMTQAGIAYTWGASPGFFVGERCPCCGFDDFWMYQAPTEEDRGRDVFLACWSGCEPSAIIGSLTMAVPNGRLKSDMHSLYVADTERTYHGT